MHFPALGRWPRRLVLLLAGVVLLPLAVLALLQLSPVATWAARRLAGLAPLAPGASLSVGRAGGSWIGGLVLRDVVLERDGRRLMAVRRIRVRYDPRRLLGADRRLDMLVIDGARIRTRRQDGGWDLTRAFLTPADTTAAGGSFAVDRLVLTDAGVVAELAPDSILRVERLELRARELVLSDPPTVVVDSLTARVSPPTTPPLWLALAARGAATPEVIRLDTLQVDGDRSRLAARGVLPRRLDDERIVDRLELEVAADPLALADIAGLVPSVSPEGVLRLEARAGAEGRRASGKVHGRVGTGRFTLEGSTLLGPGAPAEYRLAAELRGLDPSLLAVAAPAGPINVDLSADLRGPSLDRADGRADLRVWDSRVGTTALSSVRLGAAIVAGRADFDLRAAVDEGRLRARGWLRPFDSIPSYRLAGTATGLPGTDSITPMLAGAEGDPRLEVGFRVSGHGVSAETARVTGRATLTAVRTGGERTSLGHTTLAVAGRRVKLRPELLVAGGRVAADVTGRLDQPVTYEIHRGVIDRVDLGRLLGDSAAAPVSGRFGLTGRGTTPAQAAIRANLTLDEARYGAYRLENVTARLVLEQACATVAVRGGLQGGRVEMDAVVRPFDSTPGFTIRRAALDRVDVGTLLNRAELAGPVTARVDGEGRWGAAAKTFRGRLRVEPSTLGRIEVQRGDLALGLARGRLRYEGTIVTSGGALSLAGEGRPLDAVPAYAIRRGRADSLNLGVLLGREGLTTRIDARFSAEARGNAADSLQARVALDLLPSRVNRAEIRSARADVALDRGRLEGEVRADAEGAELLVRLAGRIANEVWRLRAEGALRVDSLAPWTGDTARYGHLAGRFTLDGAADSLGLLALAGTVTANGAVDSVRLDTLQLALSPGDRVLRVDTLVVRSNVATLDGGGRLALREAAGGDTLRVAAVMRDPMPLVTLAGADSVSLDSARLRLTASGAPGARRLALEGTAHRLLYAGNQVERLTVDGSADLAAEGLAGAAGRLDLEGAALGSVVVREARIAGRYDSVVALEASALLRDSIALDATLRGTASGDTLRGTLERLDLAEGGRRWALERPAAFDVRPRRYAVDYFALRAGESRLTLDGVLDRAGPSDLSAELRGFDLAPLRSLGMAPFAGEVGGNLRLTGPAEAPELVADVRTSVRADDGEEIGRIGAKVEWTSAGLRLDAEAANPERGRLTVAGTLPYRLTLAPPDTAQAVGMRRLPGDALGLRVRADSFDLAFFEPFVPTGTVERLHGTVSADGQVSGTMEAPRADGTLAVRGLTVTLPAIGVRYEQGELTGRLDDDRLTVERLRLVTDNGGELTAGGSVLLTPLTDPALDLTAELRNFRVSHSATLRTIASGRLRLEGTAALPVMTGKLTLGRTDIFTGTGTAASANVEEIELTDEDLQQLARDFGPSVLARAKEGPGLVDRFRLDLDVRMPRRVWFRQRGNMKSDIELFGEVKVRQEPGGPMGFFGKVETVPGRGFLELYGREFRLQQGDITLDGPAESVVLDVTAQYQVPTQADPGDDGILIDVNATGRPDSLKLAFTSEPSMSQDDIVSYIVTGRPASENPLAREETGEGPGAAEAGAEVALGRLSESVAGAAGEALGLDVFQIRQDGLRGLTLTAGRYVASRVFLSLQQPIQLSSDARTGSSSALGPGFELEYSMRRWLRATLRGGNVPPRFFFRGRHAF